MKHSIVCLTRGYNSKEKYDSLIIRNARIYEHINSKLRNQYPLIIFHEGNINEEHQEYIRDSSLGQTVIFIDISPTWIGGYHGMCRFNTYDIWNYVVDYDYILRIDEDCHITDCNKDPFSYVNDNVFLKVASWAESHVGTNNTLPSFIEKLTMKSASDFYIHQFPYTNVCLSKVSFWLNPEINEILKTIALDPMQTIYRWGDLPILGSLLNIFAADRVAYFSEFNYIHTSHNNQIINCK
jgi:hypothetical protein